MADPFARMHERLLATTRLGREALLRGTTPCSVNVEKGIAVTGEYGEVTGHRTLLYIQSHLQPRSGDSLTLGETVNGVFVPGEAFVLDSLESDDGYASRFFVV